MCLIASARAGGGIGIRDNAQQVGTSPEDDAKDEGRAKPRSQHPDVFELGYTKRCPQGACHGSIFRFWNHKTLLKVPRFSECIMIDPIFLSFEVRPECLGLLASPESPLIRGHSQIGYGC